MPSQCLSHNSHIQVSMGKLTDSDVQQHDWIQSAVVHAIRTSLPLDKLLNQFYFKPICHVPM